MTARTSRVLRAVALLAASCVALTGCQGLYGSLPGGAARGSDVYRVTVQFHDVLDLVPQSAVKVDDVTVGAVEKIWLDGWTAKARLRIKDSVKLPDNAVAELRQTSLLGEKFVSLAPPPGAPAAGRLGDGDVIPLSRSGRNPEVEEVLGALSLLLNGGGVAQLKTINVELGRAMTGHEQDIRGLITQLNTFVGGLDARKADIVRALDGVDRLAATLVRQKADVATALDNLGPGLKVLADQRAQLTRMLTALSQLGVVGTRVIRQSKANTVADLQALAPILSRLRQAGTDLPGALEMLFTYPFPAAVTNAVKGDFTNLRVTAQVDLRSLPKPGPLPTGLPTGPLPTLPVPLPTLPTLPVPTLPVPTICPTLPGLPPVPGCPTPGSTPVPTGTGGGGVLCPPICFTGGSASAASAEPAYDAGLLALLAGGYLS